MKRFIIYVSAGCFSFTFSFIFYYLFRSVGLFPQLSEGIIIGLFLISAAITALLYFVHMLPVSHPLAIRLLELGCVIAVLMAAGLFFNLFPFRLFYIGTVGLSGLFVYVFVILMVFLNNKATEHQINQAIAIQKRRDSNAAHN